MRAKSIKNKARVNAELSPAELKALLKKAQRDHAQAGAYIGLLEQEVNVWRAGGQVDKEQWASMEKALGLAPGELDKLAPPMSAQSSRGAGSGASTPRVGALDRVTEGDGSRPMTPVDKDEREEWLRRENDLQDQLAKAVSGITLLRRRAQGIDYGLARLNRNLKLWPRKSLYGSCKTNWPG